MLQLLVDRAPHVVDKTEIFAVVWKDTAVTDNALTRIVAQLRKALDDDARAPRYIATVAARGYRLLPPVRRSSATTTPAPVRPRRAGGRGRTTSLRRRRRASALAGVGGATMVVVAVAAWFVIGKRLVVRGFPFGPSLPPMTLVRTVGNVDLATAAALSPEQMTVATGFDGYLAFSPDGTTIADSSDRLAHSRSTSRGSTRARSPRR